MRTCLLVFLFSSPLLAQTTVKAAAQGAMNIGDCVRSLQDQNGGGCIEASSAPTLGALFPYPGFGNSIDVALLATVGGGECNSASAQWSTIGGGRFNVASGRDSTVGGGWFNDASARSSTVGGGNSNRASGSTSTISGGGNSVAPGSFSTVGGGLGHFAPGDFSTIGGGYVNSAVAARATVGGGDDNHASGHSATVSGGLTNTASGLFSTSPGGRSNTASGEYSFAAGRQAKANHDGAFVWGDSAQMVNKISTAIDQFNIYASGGTRIFSNSAASAGVSLAPGGGSWTSVSDRNAKENIEVVDAREILERLAAIPISTWNYKTQDESIRHMGPMAQDFFAAFGLGLGETGIDTIDPDGVALAAIQGLNARLAEKDAEIAALREATNAQIAALQDRLEKLERY